MAHEDSSGDSRILFAGDFLRRTVGKELRLEETNTSRCHQARVFRVRLRTSLPSLECSQEQRRFSAAQRRGGLCLVASPDGRHESLHLGQDVFIYSALLDPGQHLALEISSIRCVWLHVVRGVLSLRDLVISQGDSVFLIEERALSLRALEKSEILLLDLASDPAACEVVSSVSSMHSESNETLLHGQGGVTRGNGRMPSAHSTVGGTPEGGQ